MIRLTNILNEIGEGVKPFPYKVWTGSSTPESWLKKIYADDMLNRLGLEPPIAYLFSSDQADYIVYINGDAASESFLKDMGKVPEDATLDHQYEIRLEVAFDVKGSGEQKLTNFGEQFRVISTVTECVVDTVKKLVQDKNVWVKEVHIGPKKEKGEGLHNADETKRGRLYLAYINKQLSRFEGNWRVRIDRHEFVLIRES